jgi:predicted GNAT family acetyltransferase
MTEVEMPDNEISVTDNAMAHQYEAYVDGKLARLVYELRGDAIVLTHAEVHPSIEGRGIGSQVVRAALDDARARGLRVVPRCPFVHAYIRRHPEYRDLVAGARTG